MNFVTTALTIDLFTIEYNGENSGGPIILLTTVYHLSEAEVEKPRPRAQEERGEVLGHPFCAGNIKILKWQSMTHLYTKKI